MFRGFWRGWKYSVSYLFNTSPRCSYDSALSLLRLLASHKTNFESEAQGAWELDILPFGRCHFFL